MLSLIACALITDITLLEDRQQHSLLLTLYFKSINKAFLLNKGPCKQKKSCAFTYLTVILCEYFIP